MADGPRRRWPTRTGSHPLDDEPGVTEAARARRATSGTSRGAPARGSRDGGTHAADADALEGERSAPTPQPVPAPSVPAQGAERVVRGAIDGTGLRLGIVCSRFNGQITTRLLTGARGQLAIRDVLESSTTIAWVPGVFELPLAARALALQGGVDAIVCLGAAIRGETSQYDFVAAAVANACQQVQLESGIPVSFGVVTTDDLQQALELSGGRYGNRGAEAVDTAIEMASLLVALVATPLGLAEGPVSSLATSPPLGADGPVRPR